MCVGSTVTQGCSLTSSINKPIRELRNKELLKELVPLFKIKKKNQLYILNLKIRFLCII